MTGRKPDMTCWVSVSGRILYVDDGTAARMGHVPAQVIGRPWQDTVVPEERDALLAPASGAPVGPWLFYGTYTHWSEVFLARVAWTVCRVTEDVLLAVGNILALEEVSAYA